MQVKTFQAVTMKEALSKVKAEMGRHAVILNTSKVKTGNAFGIFSRPLIEITAALDEDVREEREKSRRPAKRKKGKVGAVGGMEKMVHALGPLREEIRMLKEVVGFSAEAGLQGRREIKQAAILSDELTELKSMIGLMLEQSDLYKGAGLEQNYLVCYRRLMERGIEPEFALKAVHEVKESVPGGRELELRRIVEQIIEKMSDAMIVGDPINGYMDTPQLVALVGPTGSGKTTTIAKLAARLEMSGKKVGLVTIDGYRIAAVEQLKIYAGLLNVPLEVALTPDELVTAINGFSSKDVVFIDTAGHSQRDGSRLKELESFLGDGMQIENYLVLSAAADKDALDEAVRNFGRLPLTGLIFTKLDETVKPGVVISQNLKTGLPVVYCTTGQKVPEDIEIVTSKTMAARLFKKGM